MRFYCAVNTCAFCFAVRFLNCFSVWCARRLVPSRYDFLRNCICSYFIFIPVVACECYECLRFFMLFLFVFLFVCLFTMPQDGTEVNDVQLPPWANGPADFILKHRAALEVRKYCSRIMPSTRYRLRWPGVQHICCCVCKGLNGHNWAFRHRSSAI